MCKIHGKSICNTHIIYNLYWSNISYLKIFTFILSVDMILHLNILIFCVISNLFTNHTKRTYISLNFVFQTTQSQQTSGTDSCWQLLELQYIFALSSIMYMAPPGVHLGSLSYSNLGTGSWHRQRIMLIFNVLFQHFILVLCVCICMKLCPSWKKNYIFVKNAWIVANYFLKLKCIFLVFQVQCSQ